MHPTQGEGRPRADLGGRWGDGPQGLTEVLTMMMYQLLTTVSSNKVTAKRKGEREKGRDQTPLSKSGSRGLSLPPSNTVRLNDGVPTARAAGSRNVRQGPPRAPAPQRMLPSWPVLVPFARAVCDGAGQGEGAAVGRGHPHLNGCRSGRPRGPPTSSRSRATSLHCPRPQLLHRTQRHSCVGLI